MPRATIPAKDSGLALDTALDLLARAGEGEELEPDKARPAPGTHGRKPRLKAEKSVYGTIW